MGRFVSSRLERAWLRAAFNAAVDADVSLGAQLESIQSSAQQVIASGQIVSATSRGNSVTTSSVSFVVAVPIGGLNPVTLVEFIEELIIEKDEIADELSLTDDATNRAAIYQEMMDRRKDAPTEAYTDFTQLRTGFASP